MLHIARWCSVKLCPTKPSAQHMSLQDMGRVLGNRTGVVLLLRLQAQDGKGCTCTAYLHQLPVLWATVRTQWDPAPFTVVGFLLRVPYKLTGLCAGGTFKTHGLLYDNTYDRSLYAPGNSNCTGPSGYQVPFVSTLYVLDTCDTRSASNTKQHVYSCSQADTLRRTATLPPRTCCSCTASTQRHDSP